jgi:glutamate 5-kinase
MQITPENPSSASRRQLLAGVRSIVIKIGTNALSTPDGKLDHGVIGHLCEQIARIHQRGIGVTVVSSGAIGAGITEMNLPGRPRDLPMLQAAASVGQSILMHVFAGALRPHGLRAGQILITRTDFEDRGRYLNLRNCIHALQRSDAVPIVNENDTVSVAEIRFGDNDLIGAQITNLLRADLLILLTVVEGVLDAAGQTIPVLQDADDGSEHVTETKSSRGTGGMGSKLFAAGTVQTAGEPVLIANGKRPNVILDLLAGEPIGTLVMPGNKRLSARSRWIGLTARTRGQLQVDAGCVTALKANKSLLAIGIVGSTGEFVPGDPVEIVDAAGKVVARGLTNYGRGDVEKIRGKRSSEFAGLLGVETYYDEVIHRDDLVVE